MQVCYLNCGDLCLIAICYDDLRLDFWAHFFLPNQGKIQWSQLSHLMLASKQPGCLFKKISDNLIPY